MKNLQPLKTMKIIKEFSKQSDEPELIENKWYSEIMFSYYLFRYQLKYKYYLKPFYRLWFFYIKPEIRKLLSK